MNRYWAVADIHGRYDLWLALFAKMVEQGFDFAKGDIIVQMGDRNDRGPDTYSINEWFKVHSIMWPKQVICLMGNHDRMLIDAGLGRSDLMYYNGGQATEKSYSKVTGIYGKNGLGNSVQKAGHWDWLRSLPLYHETPEYFFSHAPIPLEKYRDTVPGTDFRLDEHTLTWSYNSSYEIKDWVDTQLIPIETNGNYEGKYKLTLSGHLHRMKSTKIGNQWVVEVPGVEKFGNSILLDTGAGCAKEGYLSCVRLPDLLVITSEGKVYPLQDK